MLIRRELFLCSIDRRMVRLVCLRMKNMEHAGEEATNERSERVAPEIVVQVVIRATYSGIDSEDGVSGEACTDRWVKASSKFVGA